MSDRNVVGLPAVNGFAPKQGPKMMTDPYDFSTNAAYDFDFVPQIERNMIDFIQSVYVDNRLNANTLTIAFQGSQYVLLVPPRHQGVYPVFAGDSPKGRISTTAASGVIVTCIWFNIPQTFLGWITSNSTPIGPLSAPANLGTVADVTVPAAATILLAALGTRVNAVIVSNPANTADIRIGDSNVAAGRGALLAPGQMATISTSAAIYGFGAGSNPTVSIFYTFN